MPSAAIFLSYASQDADAARRICEALRAAGLEVWFDQSELRGGDAWDASIRKQIKECALFIPIISANTNAREEGYFRREWNLAVNRMLDMAEHKSFLLPVILDGVSEPAAVVPDKFRERQWSRLFSDDEITAFAMRAAKLLVESGTSGINAPKAAPALEFSKTTAPPAEPDDTPSIAVLPFVNMSRDEENEYFADGLAEELLNVIAKIRGLRVAARTSSFSFKGKSVDIQTIAAKLNVGTVLEGSVRKAGNRIRVTAQLINAADGYHLWSETYDRTLDDIFAVQDDIAQAVVKELQAALMGGAKVSEAKVEAAVHNASKGRTDNAEAYGLWLQGRHLFKRGAAKDRDDAVRYFRQAIERDPNYAAAWASLGHAIYWRTASGGAELAVEDYVSGYREAKLAVEKAIALEPELPEAYVALAYIHGSLDWDMRLGEAAVRRALALAPGDAEVTVHAALHLLVRGHYDEAEQLSRRTIELDPLNHNGYMMLARTHFYLDRFAEAEAGFHKAMEINPHRWGRGFLVLLTLAQGRIADAVTLNAGEPAEEYRLLGKVFIYWAEGRRDEADSVLAEVIAKYGEFFGWQVAQAYAFRGDADNVFHWMERCYVQHDPGVHWALVDPLFRSVHQDARWKPMLQKLGFDV